MLVLVVLSQLQFSCSRSVSVGFSISWLSVWYKMYITTVGNDRILTGPIIEQCLCPPALIILILQWLYMLGLFWCMPKLYWLFTAASVIVHTQNCRIVLQCYHCLMMFSNFSSNGQLDTTSDTSCEGTKSEDWWSDHRVCSWLDR